MSEHIYTVELYKGIKQLEEQHQGEAMQPKSNKGRYEFLISTIQGEKHKGYDEKISRQKWYSAVAEGESYNDFLKSFAVRETTKQFEARKAITIPKTPSVIGKISSFIAPALRQPKSINRIGVNGKDGKEQDRKLVEAVSRFGSKGETLLKWVESIAVAKNMARPNDYVVVKYDAEKELCYPEILKCENILNIKEDAKGVSDLIYLYTLKVPTGKNIAAINQYTQYSFGENINFIEKAKDKGLERFYAEIERSSLFAGTIELDKITYFITIEPTREEKMIFPFGYIVDYNREDCLYLPFWHKANDLMDSCIQDGSKYDVTKYMHAFLKSVSYYEKCKHQKAGEQCIDGVLSLSRKPCPNCKGTGKVGAFSSDMDKVEIMLPESDGYPVSIKPSEYMHYVDVPIDMPKFLKEIEDEYYQKASEAIYGVDMGQKAKSPVTATQILEQQGTGHSVVVDFITATPTRLYKGIAKAIAAWLDIPNPVIEFAYAHDVSILTIDDLLSRLKTAKDAGAPPSVISAIEASLEEKQAMSRTRDNNVQKLLDSHKPYAHLPDSLAINLILNLPENNPKRVLWENFTQISARIKEKETSFEMLTYESRQEIVDTIVSSYVQQINERLEEALSRDMEQLIEE